MKSDRAMVIVGAGEAGTAAAVALRENGWTGPVALIGNETSFPYERPPLSKSVLIEDEVPAPKFLIASERLVELAIDYHQGHFVDAIDRASRTVTLSGGKSLAYERMLMATGARPRALNVPIGKGCKLASLRTYTDALAIRTAIKPGSKVVIIGGGFIGLEVAASAVSKGANVAVLEAGPRLLMRAVPAGIAERIRAKHENAGVCVKVSSAVVGVEPAEGRSSVVLADGQRHLADLVLVGVGATPNTELAQAAGLAIDNGIATQETLATSDPDIFAAGDCCSFVHGLYGKRIRLEVWRNAWQQGAAAAANMLGANTPYQHVPWFWSEQYDETLQIAGICSDGNTPICRDLSEKGQIHFYVADDGHVVAACGFGSLSAIAKEIRVSEAMIAKRLAPSASALADAAIALKSLMV
ncbi:ferredoxin reductase [Mesorhizobium loti]|uniref:Ferredoxin reductase n=1 Tax=Rhizobium loti TaxID=381 RepID=A0A117N1U0_RHILI|nr:ferredoxin reductase [Mesorhizobium loti]